jgi:hypothetical protein
MFSLAVKFFKLICSFVYYFLADFCVISSLFDLFFSHSFLPICSSAVLECPGHALSMSPVSSTTAQARRRRQIRMGKRPLLTDGVSSVCPLLILPLSSFAFLLLTCMAFLQPSLHPGLLRP